MNPLVSSLNQAAEAWSSYVFGAAWQSAVVGLGMLLVLRFGRRWPAPLRYGLLLVALFKFVCPPMLDAPTGLFSRFASSGWDAEHEVIKEASTVRVAPPTAPLPFEAKVGVDAVTESVAQSARSESPIVAAASSHGRVENEPPGVVDDWQEVSRAPRRRVGSPSAHLNWRSWLMLSHLFGVAILVGWTAWQLRLLRRLVSRSREITSGPYYERLVALARDLKTWRTPRLLASPEAASPMAFGTWRPTVIIPARLLASASAGDLQTVLAHEIAHLRRGDTWINWLRIVVVTAWWFHPVAWLVSRALRRVHEDCCDDLLLVGRLTSDTDYCETLLRVASQINGGATSGMALGMAHRLHPLGNRLLRVMDRSIRRRARLSFGGACLLALLAAALLPGLGHHSAQASTDEPNEPPAEARAKVRAEKKAGVATQPATTAGADEIEDGDAAVAGIAIDAEGNRVAQTTVWLLGGESRDDVLERRAETKTDDSGHFAFLQFSEEELFQAAQGQTLPTLIARDERHRLGWSSNLRTPDAKKVELRLHDVGEFHGKLLDSLGKPIAGATVRPYVLNGLSVRDQGYDGTMLTAELVDEWRTTSAGDGGFVMRNVPVAGSLTTVITAPGYGQPKVRWNLGRSVTIRLQAAGAINGSIELPDGVDLPAGLSLDLRRQTETKDVEEHFRVYYFRSAPVHEKGRFEFTEVPPGEYVISLQHQGNSSVYGDSTPPIVVTAGGRVAGVKLPLKRAFAVRGVAVDNRDKQPVKGATLRFSSVDRGNFWRYLTEATTDENGRFTGYVKPGKIAIQVWAAPAGYLSSIDNGRIEPMDVQSDVETVVEVDRAIIIRGAIVDVAGRPVPGAEIYPFAARHIGTPLTGIDQFAPAQKTDQQGAFKLANVDPWDNLSVRVRAGAAVSDGAIVFRPDDDKPVRIEIRESNACHVIGRVVDELGRPRLGAPVILRSDRAYESIRTIIGLSTTAAIEALQTDSDGRFRSPALWPRDSYQASVKVEGYETAESKRVVSKAGETIDLGTIVLRRNDGFVAGRVVDSSGKPLASVTVFNSGDALQPISMVSDAGGRFRLSGLFGGPVYVFARKTGYRFTGMRTASGSDHLALTLLRTDEPPSADQPAPLTDESAHRDLARWMLEQFWQISRETDKWLLIRYMARLDSDQAAKWSAQLGGRNDAQIAIGIGEQIDDLSRESDTHLDLDDTLAVVAGLGDSRAVHLLIDLAQRTLKTHPVDSQRYSEEALLRVRKLTPPERIWSIAHLGNVLSRLGRTDAGKKLLDEAADAAEQLSADDRAAFARGMVARELANHDLPRAKNLLEPVSAAADKARYLSWLAEALAEKNLNEALAIVEQIGGGLDAEALANTTRMKIAYRIAPERAQEALRIVDEMHGHSAGKTRAEALSWIAVQIAPHDKPAAIDLVDRSLAIYLDAPEEFRSWTNYGGRPVFAAWAARQALAVGYPDMRSVVMRVLAARPAAREESNPARRLEATVATAWVLAFTDPATSRDLLSAVESFGDLIGSGYSSVHRGEWLNAWALADPEHARQIFEHELAALRDHSEFDLQRSGLLRAAEMLSQPRSQWPRHLLINFGPFWLPGEE